MAQTIASVFEHSTQGCLVAIVDPVVASPKRPADTRGIANGLLTILSEVVTGLCYRHSSIMLTTENESLNKHLVHEIQTRAIRNEEAATRFSPPRVITYALNNMDGQQLIASTKEMQALMTSRKRKLDALVIVIPLESFGRVYEKVKAHSNVALVVYTRPPVEHCHNGDLTLDDEDDTFAWIDYAENSQSVALSPRVLFHYGTQMSGLQISWMDYDASKGDYVFNIMDRDVLADPTEPQDAFIRRTIKVPIVC